MKQGRSVKLILILFICSSCNALFDISDENKFVKCTKPNSCFEIKIEGSIIDKAKNDSIKNIPITLNWVNPTSSFSADNTIDIQYSNNSGNFSFLSSIDTSFFSKGYYLNVSIPIKNDYIVFPRNTFSIYNPTDSIIKNLKYEFYPKTRLLIQIIRQMDDVFETFSVSHTFRKNFGYVDKTIHRNFNQYDSPVNDSYNVETAANIKTYITWVKTINSVRYEKTDSIICKQNTQNIYKIKY